MQQIFRFSTLIYFLLLCALLLGQEGSWKKIVDDVFDKDSAGARVPTWNGAYRVELDENKINHIHVDVLTKGSASKSFKEVSKVARFTFKISASDVSGQVPAPYLRSGSKNIIKCAVINKSFRAYDADKAQTLVPLAANAWLEVELLVDFGKKTYTAQIKNGAKLENLKFTEDATSVDNVLFNCSLVSFGAEQYVIRDEKTEGLKKDWSTKISDLRKISLPEESLRSGLSLFAADKLETLVASENFQAAGKLYEETLEVLKKEEPNYETPANDICPNIPQAAKNTFFLSATELWGKQSQNTSPVVIKGYAMDLTRELQNMALATFHPQSSLKGNGKSFRRFLMVMDAMSDEWNQGKRLGDFSKDQEVPQAYCLIRAAYPTLKLPYLFGTWENALKANVEELLKQHQEVYQTINVNKVWVNSDVRHIVSLVWSAKALGRPELKTLADKGLILISKTLQGDGGFNYVGYQNEAFTYHGENIAALAWYYLATGNPLAKELIIKSKAYYPLTYHPRGVGEYFTPTMMKQYWNMATPGTAAYYVASLADCPYNYSLATKEGADILAAFFYRSDLEAKTLPDNWLLFDRNTLGPRGRFGNYTYGGSTRDSSWLPGKKDNELLNLIGNMNSGFVGSMTLMDEKEAEALPKGEGTYVPSKWPLSSAVVNITTEIKVEKGIDLDVSRRTKHRFMAQNQHNAVSMSKNYSALSTSYLVTDKIAGGDADVKALPWIGHQAWLLSPQGMVGILSLKATAQTTSLGVHGSLLFVSGRESWGLQRNLVTEASNRFSYGDLKMVLWENDFSKVSFEKTDIFTGVAKKCLRLVLYDVPSSAGSDEALTYQKDAGNFWIVDLRPKTSVPLKNVKKLKLPKGLQGFEVEETDGNYKLIQNTTEQDIDILENFPCQYAKASLFVGEEKNKLLYSEEAISKAKTTGEGIGRLIPLRVSSGEVKVHLSVPAYSHVMLTMSSEAKDHALSTDTYETFFK